MKSRSSKLVILDGGTAGSRQYSRTNLVEDIRNLDEEEQQMENSENALENSNDFENTINLEFTGKSPRGAVRGAAKDMTSGGMGWVNDQDQDQLEQSRNNTLTAQDPCLDGLADISEVIDGEVINGGVSADGEDFDRQRRGLAASK